MKYILYMIFVLFSLANVCNENDQVNIMDKRGFETEEMTKSDVELFLENVEILMLFKEPIKEPIKCFDVNEQGMVAIGTEDGNNKMICIYSNTGNFQYGYKFNTYGSFDVELNGDILEIYFVRSDVDVSINNVGEIQNISRICNIPENNTYWNNYVRATNKKVGDQQYVLKNDIGILGVFATSYSQLCKTDNLGNEVPIYDANKNQFYSILIWVVGITVFVAIVLTAIIKELKKGSEYTRRKYNI